METQNLTLPEIVLQGIRDTKAEAGRAIDDLTAVARELSMAETAGNFADARERLDSDTFNLMVMGRFKNGKSTLLNALLGGTTRPVGAQFAGSEGPMVVDDLPATAILTGVQYAEEPYVSAWSFDGRREDWTFERYLRESTLDTDPLVSAERFKDVRQFEMGFPARLCQAGVVVFDSPGLDDTGLRNEITREAGSICDAAIVVYRSDVLMGQSELMDAGKLLKEGTQVFTVVNMFNGRKADDRVRSYVWNKFVREYLDGPPWDGQDLTPWGVYFVDAERARRNRYSGDAAPDDSGLQELEDRLGEFLIENRHQSHLKKHTTRAAELADGIDRHIGQRLAAVQTDRDDLLAAYTRLLPSLNALRDRPQKLPRIFARYRAEAEAVLTTNANALITGIRQELPGYINGLDLDLGAVTGMFRQKAAVSVVSTAATGYVNERFSTWAGQDLPNLMRPIQEELSAQIDEEITAVGSAFDALHLELTGWQPTEAGKALVATKERVAAAVAGFALGGVGGAVAGGAGGLRGAAASAVGSVGAVLVLSALGVTAAPIVIPAAIAASLLAGAAGAGVNLDKRIKQNGIGTMDEHLHDLPGTLVPRLLGQLRQAYTDMETVTTDEISALIAEEERTIQGLVQENQREQHDRQETEQWLTELGVRTAAGRAGLRDALAKAQQV